MIVVFIYPFIVMSLHTLLQIIIKKKGKDSTAHKILLACGQIVLPLLFIVFSCVYYYAGLFFANQLQTTKLGAFNDTSKSWLPTDLWLLWLIKKKIYVRQKITASVFKAEMLRIECENLEKFDVSTAFEGVSSEKYISI